MTYHVVEIRSLSDLVNARESIKFNEPVAYSMEIEKAELENFDDNYLLYSVNNKGIATEL